MKRKNPEGTGRLARLYREALQYMDAQKAAGVPFLDRIKGLDQVLRSAWPQGREWHYLCEQCNDTGLVVSVCRKGARCNGISTRTDSPGQQPGKYRRLCALNPNSDYEHDYSAPCWCAAGGRWRQKPPSTDDGTNVGKSKPKPWSRAGR